MRDLGVSRITATKYLELLVEHDFLVKEKVGRVNFYINKPLFELFIAPYCSGPAFGGGLFFTWFGLPYRNASGTCRLSKHRYFIWVTWHFMLCSF